MSLRQYEYALAIAEEGSVTAAAERLRVAQPSVSQQIRSLERELGVDLFARTPQGLVPTVVGRAFLREAEIAVTASRRARAAALAGAAELTGELTVAVELGLGFDRMPRALAAFRREFPGVEVTVHDEADIERLARAGTLDLGLVSHTAPNCPCVPHLVDEERLVVALGHSHPLLASSRLRMADLAGDPWVQYAHGSTMDEIVTRAIKDAGVTVTTAARAPSVDSALRLAAWGLGVAIVPEAAVPEACRHLTRPLDPALSRPLFATVRANPGPAEAALLRHLLAV
ncbi:LysR family transcriptional regulator [Kutzneria sp. NPDC051319]|uniref:LysR family transcriptional regulator n=1 Tax=Kutzneria sp. NPDC051319 TaxID=3155047 RepID=UPI003437E113